MEPRPNPTPEACALAAGVTLAALDGALLRSGPAQLWATAAAVVLFSAALLGLATRLALALTARLGRGRWLRSLAGGALALVVVVPVSVLLFRGTGIRIKWYAPYGPFVVGALLLAITVLGLRVAGRLGRWATGPRRRGLLLPGPLVLAALLLWADHRLYPNQYAYLHWLLLLLATVGLMASAWLAWPRRARPPRWILPALLAATLPAFVAAAAFSLDSNRLRQLFVERTHSAARMAAVYRSLLDRDGDHHSVIFGERDCDNSRPEIHPFAEDIPENGVDEDCDGKDARRPPPKKTVALDETGYRRRLGSWLNQPPLAPHLEQTARMNVVLIVLDALRQSEVVPGPESQASYPRLMKLLGGSRNFTRTFSTGAGTDIGMATIFTGQLNPFAETNRTLLQAFQGAGYHTHGVFQREVERWVGRQFSLKGLSSRKIVVNDPFRRDLGTQATSQQVTDAGIRFVEGHADRRFFLWLHYFDIHEHHQIDARTLDERPDPVPPRGLPFYRMLVSHVDRQVGRFVDALRERGLLERTLLVLLADHGEGLAESPRLPQTHGDVLFNPLVHVPMGFRIPNLAGRTLDVPASLADLFPTLLDLARIPRSSTDGISLVPYLFGAHAEQLAGFTRPLFMLEVKQKAVILWPWKFLAWQDQGLVELYNLEQDYAETNNRADDLPEVAGRMSRLLSSRKLITINRLVRRTPRR